MKALPVDTVPALYVFHVVIVHETTGHREVWPIAAATLADARRKAADMMPAWYRPDITIVQH